MTQALLSASLCHSLVCDVNPRKFTLFRSRSQAARISSSSSSSSSFARGSPLLVGKISSQRKSKSKAMSVSIRAGQSTEKESNSLDIWLGRFAMVGFASAITVEVATGKGLLENFGLTTPLPTVALAVTGLVGVLTAFFIFQSASTD